MPRTLMAWCPDWPVFAAARAAGEDPDGPVAVLASGRVYACSSAARKAGVRRGLRRREAQARCPDLTVLDYDPVVDARAFEPVVAAIEHLAPGVEVVRPGMAAVAVRGPARYFGGEDAFAEALLDHLDVAGFPAVMGIADGPFAAEQAARMHTVFSPGASARCLAPLPVETLQRPELADLLRRLGIRTLGAFAQLPAGRVLARFGHDGALAHRLASGREDRPLAARRPPPDLAVELVLDGPVDRVEQVAFSVRPTAEELVSDLAGRDLVCTCLRVEAVTGDGAVSERAWRHPRWFAAADVADRVRWQLRAGLPGRGAADGTDAGPDEDPDEVTDGGAGVVRVRLVPVEVERTGAFADGLWDDAGPDEHVHRAVGRVQSMLGHEAVVTPMVTGGRAPADRVTYVPWGDAGPAGDAAPMGGTGLPGGAEPPGRAAPPGGAGSPGGAAPVGRVGAAGRTGTNRDGRAGPTGSPWPGALPSPLPSRVLPEPRPIDPGAELPEPVGWAGPWPVRERWWDPERAREYDRYQVACADGSAYVLIREHDRWYLEGSYD